LLAFQLLGHREISIHANHSEYRDNFQQGLGTPFATLLKSAALMTITSNYLDNRLELKTLALLNMNEAGWMLSGSADYSPFESFNIELAISFFNGDPDQDENYIFNRLENFSNYSVGVKYSF